MQNLGGFRNVLGDEPPKPPQFTPMAVSCPVVVCSSSTQAWPWIRFADGDTRTSRNKNCSLSKKGKDSRGFVGRINYIDYQQ